MPQLGLAPRCHTGFLPGIALVIDRRHLNVLTHFQGFAPQPHIDGTGRRRQNHTVVIVRKVLGVKAPPINRILKTAHHRKTQCRHAGGQPVNHGPCLLGRLLQPLTHRRGTANRFA